MLNLLQHAVMLTSRRLLLMHIPLSPAAGMEIIILSPLQRRFGNHIGIAGVDGVLLGLEAWGIDVACATSL